MSQCHFTSSSHIALWHRLNRKDLPAFESDVLTEAIAPFDVAALENLGQSAHILYAFMTSSTYLKEIIISFPDEVMMMLTSSPENSLQLFLQKDNLPTSADAMAETWRERKRKLSLLLALLHFHDDYEVMEIIGHWSDFAQNAVETLLNQLMQEAYAKGLAEPINASKQHGLFILAMGKLGGRELNYSSDIDLIAFYDEGKINPIKPDYPKGFFVNIIKQLLALLQNRTNAGYIFRTDFRLRPDPSSTAIAMSTDAAMLYYEQFGQTWERSAFIKARVIAGDEESGQQFLKELKPFIYRKYMDFAAIDDIHLMKRRIEDHYHLNQQDLTGYNLKLGRGGIREVEFFVQCQQLISGGRLPQLQGCKTLAMLDELHHLGMVKAHEHFQLTNSYHFLRECENAIQMMRDEQTHSLPLKPEDMTKLAALLGMHNRAILEETLSKHLNNVISAYDKLFHDETDKSDEIDEAASPHAFAGRNIMLLPPLHEKERLIPILQNWGFSAIDQAASIISQWTMGGIRALESNASRTNFDKLLPTLLRHIAACQDNITALARFDRFLRNLPRGLQLFALLKSHEELQNLFIRILVDAPSLAEILSARPRLFDAILDPRFFGHQVDKTELATYLKEALQGESDYETQLDIIRIFGQDQHFLIGVRLISGTIDAFEAGKGYSAVADVIINMLAHLVEQHFQNKHGRFQKSQWGVIGMGKLGSQEMSATSDLDLIILYEYDDEEISSDGIKPLSPQHYFARLTQHLITALSAPTAQGKLYEVDMRLRPSGRNGPVATRLSGFIAYQQKEAWVWEHLALTRARVVFATQNFAQQIKTAFQTIFTTQNREDKDIAQDILDMRQRIFAEKTAKSIWDIKNIEGGQMDVELMMQGLHLMSFLPPEKRHISSFATKYTDRLSQNHQFYMVIMQLQRLGLLMQEESTHTQEMPILLQQFTHCKDFSALAEKLQKIQQESEALIIELLTKIKG